MKRLSCCIVFFIVACGGDETGPVPEWQGIPVGNRCTGVGQCAEFPGVVERNDTGGAICSTVPGGREDSSTPETCDLTDNDCNGMVDDVREGRCDRCEGLDESACTRCDDADERGIFESCTPFTCGDCDRIVSSDIDGWLCGCTETRDCPCNFVCGELDLGGGLLVAGCAPP